MNGKRIPRLRALPQFFVYVMGSVVSEHSKYRKSRRDRFCEFFRLLQ